MNLSSGNTASVKVEGYVFPRVRIHSLTGLEERMALCASFGSSGHAGSDPVEVEEYEF